MKICFLTESFYDDYSDCLEIEKKLKRPYIQICIEVDGKIFAIPFRSNINHEHVFWTNKDDKCGLDLSKVVVIMKDEYINNSKKPYIRQKEFEKLKGKEYIIKQRLITYIKKYKKAKQYIENIHNQKLCEYSTLQYFEDYI